MKTKIARSLESRRRMKETNEIRRIAPEVRVRYRGLWPVVPILGAIVAAPTTRAGCPSAGWPR